MFEEDMVLPSSSSANTINVDNRQNENDTPSVSETSASTVPTTNPTPDVAQSPAPPNIHVQIEEGEMNKMKNNVLKEELRSR